MTLRQLIDSLPCAYDTAVNAAYNDGWNDAVEQAVKIVSAARLEPTDLRSVASEVSSMKVNVEP